MTENVDNQEEAEEDAFDDITNPCPRRFYDAVFRVFTLLGCHEQQARCEKAIK